MSSMFSRVIGDAQCLVCAISFSIVKCHPPIEMNWILSIFKRQLAVVHIVFTVRSTLKHCLLNFWSTFKKSIFVCEVYAKGGGGSGDNVHLMLCVEKSTCESSLRDNVHSHLRHAKWLMAVRGVGV